MKKLFITALICVMAMTAMAGCNSSGDSSSPDSSKPTASESSADEDSSDSSDVVVSSDVISDSDSDKSSESESETDGSGESSEGFGIPLEDDDEEVDENAVYLTIPDTGVGSDEFKTVFAENPIDEYYLTEMEFAASPSKLQEIVLKARDSWESAVNSAYSDANLACENEEEAAKLTEEQKQWADSIESSVQEIRSNNSDGLIAEYSIMLFFRTRTAELLNIVYENTGNFELPDSGIGAAG